MLNDRDDKFEGQEDSEYHFSDEEVSYEVETESPKPALATVSSENVLSRLTRSKRMLISLGVFLVLVFVVYKMVAPSSTTTPSTAITAPGATNANQQTPRNTSPTIAQPTANVALSPTTVASQPAQQEIKAPAAELLPTQPLASTLAGTQPLNAPPQAMAQQPQQIAAQMPAPVQTDNLPPVIPVQTATPTYPVAQPGLSGQTPPAVTSPPAANNLNAAGIASVATVNERLVNQLQAEYVQRLNEYSTQNKNLQEQMQTLNSRVASMETQMGQLIQALTRQVQSAPNNFGSSSPAPAVETKIPYNVQAIIPGRAWLKADNGETVTVAEGDAVKDLGRVTKIDPYDGIVEINTGTRVVSLTYGSGG